MKTLYSIISIIVFLTYFQPVAFSQTAEAETWTLATGVSGNKTYIARESISLKPGFSYTATSGNAFHGKIDQTLVFPPTGNEYAVPNGTITNNPALGAAVGNLSGALDVSPSGAATYSVPIEIPAGIQGMQPTVSLVYNSQSGNGIAGMCWNISGLSMISRVPKTYYYDNDRSGIIWNNTSPLALDGQRLIVVNSSWGTDSIEYRTESGLDKIMGYSISANGPSSFKIYTKDGRVLEYGGTTEYLVLIQGSYYLGWALRKVTDTNDNYVKYTYAKTTWKTNYYGDNRISQIEYGNGTAKVASVHFQYKNKTSSFIQYIGGIETKNQLILDKIEVKGINNELQETYQLSYDVVDSNDFLTQLKRINASGEFIHPLKFEWSERNYAISDTTKMTFSVYPSYINYCQNQGYSITSFLKKFGDINGDGLTDVIVKASYKKGSNEKHYWVAYLKQPNNNQYQYAYEQEWDKDKETVFLLIDRDHDGADELYIGKYSNPTTNHYYIDIDCYKYNNATMTHSSDSGQSVFSSDYANRKDSYIVPVDVSGNGNTDFFLFSKNNKLLSPLDFGSNSLGGNANSRIYITDINGNGKNEIMYVVNNTTTFYEYNSSSNQFESINTASGFNYEDYIYVGDFNGDGNTDLLVQKKGTYENVIWVSTGTSFYQTSLGSNIINSTKTRTVYYNTNSAMIFRPSKQLLDINQDGKTDIVSCDFPQNSSLSRLKIYINTGNGFEEKQSIEQSFDVLKSLSGRGKFTSTTNKGIVTENWFNAASLYYVTLCPTVQFNKITGVTDAFNTKVNISYQNVNTPQKVIAKIDSNTGDESMSGISHSLPTELEVVKDVTTTNVNTGYTFNKPHIHWQGRGFLGFDSIQIKDNINSIVTATKSKVNSTFYFLYPYKTTVKTTGGANISESVSNYTIVNESNKKYFVRFDSQVATDALKGITTTTTYSNYDSERNPQTILTDFGNGITSTKTLTYIKKGSRFFNKISYQKVTQTTPNVPNYMREEYSFYDGKGNLTYQVKDSTDTNKVQTFYSNYDQYGNPRTITAKANGVSRTQSFTYTSGRFVQSKTNHLGETTTYNWNESKGLLNSESNRLGTTSYQYDNWGRLKMTTYPDGLKSASTLQWAGTTAGKPTNAKYYSYNETSGQSPVIIWYDALGRELRSESYGLNKQKIWIDTEYNTKGQVYRVSEPYFNTGTKTWASTYSYDTYGRVNAIVTPMGTTNYAYSGLTTTVTSPTDTKATTINSAGRVTSETTNGKSVSFTHYASGQVKTATPEGGQALTMEYDLQGNRTKLIDPDAGTISSQYDGWGQLKTEKQKIHLSADSIITNYYYHTSGLLDYKSRNDSITNYEYDNLYRLKRVSIAGKHSQAYGYDQWDRIIETRDTVENNKVFVRQTQYDQLGRVYKEIYPDGYYITNTYDSYSNLTKVSDAAHGAIWQAREMNARGQWTKTQTGNKETLYFFDDRGFPTGIFMPNTINLAYYWDEKGNMTCRWDDFGNSENVDYDNLNRLINYNAFNNGAASWNTLNYNAQGNITQKSDLNDITMGYGEIDGKKPHALTSIAGIPALISSNQAITYTDFKKVKTIFESGKMLTIDYGTDEQRIKSVLTKPGTAALTRYYMGDYEEEVQNGNVKKIHYICGGNGLAAVLVDNTLYYAHTDYQGSLIVLSNTDGSIAQRYAY
ncbi:MAG: FG-GAP-like repeat-containing protein, partial [Candidatus Symbiothrix sp.]|nr:FG-GAP-like repeat-containing protein [Candidatus Symbiothrix sp.]